MCEHSCRAMFRACDPDGWDGKFVNECQKQWKTMQRSTEIVKAKELKRGMVKGWKVSNDDESTREGVLKEVQNGCAGYLS